MTPYKTAATPQDCLDAAELARASGIDPWFLDQMAEVCGLRAVWSGPERPRPAW